MSRNIGTSKSLLAPAATVCIVVRVILTVLLWFSQAQRASPAGERPHSAKAGNYIAKWHSAQPSENGGDVVEVFVPVRNKRTGTVALHRVYRYLDKGYFTGVYSVSPWQGPPVKHGRRCTGVFVTMEFGAGSGKDFLIFADTRRGFREVLHVFEDKVKEGESLTVAHLDLDKFPEFICVSKYDYLPTANIPRVAQVWKWNRRKELYEMVRESPFKDRLKPLRQPYRKSSKLGT